MKRMHYRLFDEDFVLTTDSEEMSSYLVDTLEKHIVNETSEVPRFFANIPLLAPEQRRYLTRTAPSDSDVLRSISFSRNGRDFAPWTSTAPPLIPYNLEDLSARYSAYHAAAIEVPGIGAILLLGNKGSGKSTNSLALCREHQWHLLTDETCVVERPALRVRALLRQPHGYSIDSTGLPQKSVLRYRDNPWLLTSRQAQPRFAFELVHIPGLSTPHFQSVRDPKIATQIILRHQLQFGESTETAIAFSHRLASSVNTMQVHHGGYENFEVLRKQIAEIISRAKP